MPSLPEPSSPRRRGPPWFIENSRVPRWLSGLAPIRIGAVSLCGFVFSRGKMSERVRRHEAIHWVQQRELLLLGFFLIYPISWLYHLIRLRDGAAAYRAIPFEVEAYAHEDEPGYLERRPRYAWARLGKDPVSGSP